MLSSVAASITGGETMVDPVTGAPITERDIARREEVLARRERELEALEEQVRNGTYTPPTTRNNFPPILKWWAYYPDEDLNENIRPLMRYYFFAYGLQALAYAVNFIACLTIIGNASHLETSLGLLLGIGGFLFFVWVPLGYEAHYFLMYGAVSSGKSVKTICSLITYCIWWVILVISVIGPSSWGAIGFYLVAGLYKKDDQGKAATLQGTIGLIFAIIGLVDAAWLAFIFVRLCQFFRKEGLKQKAFVEAGHYAAEQAYNNRETLIDTAKEHPELAQQAIGAAYG
jgi:hypothetical protein